MSITTCSQCGHAAPPEARQCPKCGATLGSRPRGVAASRYQAGDIVDGRFEVIERLPGGGMGELYKVRHVHLGDFRVIKLIRGDQLADETQRKRFFQEAKIAASIKHPNVGLLHDFAALADGTFYMVQEFIDGLTISRSLRAGRRFSLGEIVDITRQVLLGLIAIHEKGIIHRDISPDNLMLCKNEGALQVRIIDLGIAKPIVAGEGQALTSAGLFIGKPHYASPEQMRMMETEETIDHRSDIYSLGVVIYEMIVGKVPFEAATPLAYLLKQISEEIRTVNRDVSGVVPPELDAFIIKMLKTKRDDRFVTARDALRGLDEVIANLPQLLYRGELGAPTADESFPRVAPRQRKKGTDEVPFDQLASIIESDRTEPGGRAAAASLETEEDDDAPATEVQSIEGLMASTHASERGSPPLATVEERSPQLFPDRTMPASTPVPTTTRTRRRKRRAITIAVVSIVFLVVVAAGGWIFYRLLQSRFGQQQPAGGTPTTAATATAPAAASANPPVSLPTPEAIAVAPVPAVAAPSAAPVTAATASPIVATPTPQTPPRTTASPANPVRSAETAPPTATIPVATAPEAVPPPPPPPTETAEPLVREGDIVAPGEGVVDAQLAKKSEPIMLPNIAVIGNRGFSMFSVLVGIDGKVESARLIRSSGVAPFDELAGEAAKRSTFTPATKDGVRVRMWRTIRYDVKARGG